MILIILLFASNAFGSTYWTACTKSPSSYATKSQCEKAEGETCCDLRTCPTKDDTLCSVRSGSFVLDQDKVDQREAKILEDSQAKETEKTAKISRCMTKIGDDEICGKIYGQ